MFSPPVIFSSAAIYVTLFCSLLISTCTSSLIDPFTVPYSLSEPDSVYRLSKKLNEVSGLSVTGVHQVALIDDERGSIFYYDLNSNKVVNDISFSNKADYEDLAINGDTAFALKSDGTLIVVQLGDSTNINSKVFDTPLGEFNDTEGLCYDQKRGVLLIACKGSPAIDIMDKRYKGKKAIYSFDPVTKKLNETPEILIDVHKVESMILGMQKNIIRRIMNLYNLTTKSVFQPSGVAIHPITSEIYVISAVGNVLLILNHDGKIRHAVKLSPKYFIQPEGIAFDSTATLYIANEGKSGKGNILKFEYKERG